VLKAAGVVVAVGAMLEPEDGRGKAKGRLAAIGRGGGTRTTNGSSSDVFVAGLVILLFAMVVGRGKGKGAPFG
jgi:hypothetical protein